MPDPASLADIADYHIDAEAGLKLCFSPANPEYASRFIAHLPSEISAELAERLSETEMRSALVTVSRVEAALRNDFIQRCRLKMPDDISITFRKIHKKRGVRIRLDEDILDVWYQNVDPPSRNVISTLRGMLKYRHWLAHGRWWNAGRKYSFQDVYSLAEAIFTDLPLCD